MDTIPCYDIFELSLPGPAAGNPFVEVSLDATFRSGNRQMEVEGFYDGGGTYRVRFMPDRPGEWRYTLHSNARELDGQAGLFFCTQPRPGVHGPVRVSARTHLAYDDGTQYFQVGTTCYAWAHQGEALENQTLASLADAPFNKLRMCVFPKHYAYNHNEPEYHAFERQADGSFDFSRFNPVFFQHLEGRIAQLGELGIEADLILFHPYDRWGYAHLPPEVDDRYLRYLVARLAAYRNLWWSFANEWDLMDKSLADWDRFFKLVQQYDPVQHLRSIHNCRTLYDHGKPWVTHVSYQTIATSPDLSPVGELLTRFGKPVVVDEACYEGDIPNRWGNITPQEMVRRFWETTVYGGYCGHGETYLHPEDILWWAKGGTLHGQSPQRLGFFRRVVAPHASAGLDPGKNTWGGNFRAVGRGNEYFLTYFGLHQPARMGYHLPEGRSYRIEVVDTWEMTVTPLPGIFSGSGEVELPARPYLALQAIRVEEDDHLRSTFNQAAQDYDAARPGYPAQLFEDVVTFSEIPPRGQALEIGCGTGQATLPFAQRGYRILCLDIGADLLALAAHNLRAYRDVRFENVSFESWPMQSGIFDLVYAATSFHWIPPEIGYPKACQALKAGGTLAIFAHIHPRPFTGFFEEVQAVYRRYLPELLPKPDQPDTAAAIATQAEAMRATGLFSRVEVHTYPWAEIYTTDRYLRLLNTYSWHQKTSQDRRRALYQAIADLIESRYEGKVERPYLTELYLGKTPPPAAPTATADPG